MKQDVLDIINNTSDCHHKHKIMGELCYHLEVGTTCLHVKFLNGTVKVLAKEVLYSSSDAQDVADIKSAVEAIYEASVSPQGASVTLDDLKSELGV